MFRLVRREKLAAVNAVPTVPTLASAAREFCADVLGIDELRVAFRGSTVFCERADRPGFRALGVRGAGVVPVFTSATQLALARGPAWWFSLSGAELPDLLATGYDILLDLAGTDALLLRPAALSARVRTSRASQAAGVGQARRPALVGPVAEATAEVCYDQFHDVPFRVGPGTWQSWVTRAPARTLGQVSRAMVVSAISAEQAVGPAGAHRARLRGDHQGTAVSLLGLTTRELRRRYATGSSEGDPGRDRLDDCL